MNEAAGALCALHPEVPALGICDRCGNYICGGCHREIAGRRICSGCLTIPGVDYVAEARQRFLGKRDGSVWMFAVLAFIYGPALLTVGWNDESARLVAFAAYWMALGVVYLLPLWWARFAPLAFIPAVLLLLISSSGGEPGGLVAIFFFSSGLMIAPLFKTRNKLAFRVEVSDRELERYHDKYLSNPMASRAFAYSLLFLLFPFLNVISFAFGALAFRKTGGSAWPPVGGRGRAITGIAISSIGVVGWAVYFVRLAF